MKKNSKKPKMLVGNFLLLVLIVWSLFAVVLQILFSASANSEVYMVLFMFSSIVGVFIHLLLNTSRNWARPDILFILSYCLVYFQWPIMFLYDFEMPRNFERHHFNYSSLGTGVRVSSLGLIFWILGYNIAHFRVYAKTFEVNPKMLGFSRVFLVVFSILFFLFAGSFYISGEVYKSGGVNSLSGVAGYISTILFFIIPTHSALVMYAAIKPGSSYATARRLVNNYYFDLFLIVAIFCVFSFAGERDVVLQLIIAVGLVYSFHASPVSFFRVIFYILAGLLFLSALGVFRSNLNGLENQGFFDLILSGTRSLALSGLPYHLSIFSVEESGYHFGLLNLGTILSIFPFGQSFYLAISSSSAVDINSAYFLLDKLSGAYATWGIGTTLVGDAYLNFGSGGVATIMLLLGVGFKGATELLRRPRSLTMFVLSIIFLSFCIYLPRTGVFSLLRPVVWGVIFYLILGKISWKK